MKKEHRNRTATITSTAKICALILPTDAIYVITLPNNLSVFLFSSSEWWVVRVCKQRSHNGLNTFLHTQNFNKKQQSIHIEADRDWNYAEHGWIAASVDLLYENTHEQHRFSPKRQSPIAYIVAASSWTHADACTTGFCLLALRISLHFAITEKCMPKQSARDPCNGT